jgi:selenide,water dikinase
LKTHRELSEHRAEGLCSALRRAALVFGLNLAGGVGKMKAVTQMDVPVVKDLVLVGGGHAHVAVLKSFGMQPIPGVRVTLISKDVATSYSGMIPGYIAGHYTFDEAHIDLRPLCQFAGAAFYHAAVAGLDLAQKQVICSQRPPVRFDLLSINIGSTPRARNIPGALEHVLPVKPIDRFLRGWERIVSMAFATGGQPLRIAVVGGGAGGVELLLAARHRLLTMLDQHGGKARPIEFHLVTDTDRLLPTHNRRVQSKFTRLLREREVRVHLNHRVVAVKPDRLLCDPGAPLPCEATLWVISAAAPEWIGAAGLRTDAEGFLALNDALQSVSHPFVFGAGDVAAVLKHPRPKSGVFAVRQGRPLTENLRLALTGQPPRPFAPQRKFLSLISTGERCAVASRGAWALEGAWVWRLKDWIDRRWMRKYQELPIMKSALPDPMTAGVADAEALKEISALAMRCGGCGAKVGRTTLERVLQRLKTTPRDDVLVGLNSPDDAAVIRVPPGQVHVQSVDFFRSFLSDPYLFGRIAANHCLGDIYAMGAEPQSALAVAVAPFGLEAKVEEQLYQLLAGATDVLTENNAALAGGHTAEGAELAFGLMVNGLADPHRLLRKGGLRPGDRLLLIKPLGTGMLFAADMRGRAKGAWIDAALASMQQSNREGAQCFLRYQATACTDVTGFGLLGHVLEMIQQSPGASVELDLDHIPLLEGVAETKRMGIFSSLQPQNLRLRRAIANLEAAARHDHYAVLFDPQTAGGLLAGVPENAAGPCLAELQQRGYARAAIIGTVVPGGSTVETVMIRGGAMSP